MYTTTTKIPSPTISMIAALARNNRAIGKDNKLLWNIPEDLSRFKQITSGHPIIMGRKTFESIGRPLPNRTNIVITRDSSFQAYGCTIVHTLEEAIAAATAIDHKEIFIIGGGELFKKGIDIADKLYLTLVEGDFEGDVFFPEFSAFNTVLHEVKATTEGYTYTFIDLAR